jgi:hypothetical protein
MTKSASIFLRRAREKKTKNALRNEVAKNQDLQEDLDMAVMNNRNMQERLQSTAPMSREGKALIDSTARSYSEPRW